MKKRLFAVLLAAVLLLSATVAAHAARTDVAPLSAQLEAGVVAANYEEVGTELEADSGLPTAYSSADLGYVTPVRTQKYNTCWAYSSCAALEVLLNKLGFETDHLSPMYMNYRSTSLDGSAGWQRTYYAAGYPYIALGYLTSIGAFKEEDFPDSILYSDYLESEYDLAPYAYAESMVYLNGRDIDTVKTAVYRYGAAVANFHHDPAMINNETDAYYCDTPSLTTSQLNGHAVAIVGWDDGYSVENFLPDHRPVNDGAWLCKNSWGSGWGSSGGYFWLSYEDFYLFDSRFGPSYAITAASLASPRVRMRHNEVFGATYEFDLNSTLHTDYSSLTYANVIDFSDEFNVIDKVIFESVSEGAAYEIFYIPLDESGAPTSDESRWISLRTGSIDSQGYLCADVDDFSAPLEKAAIGVRISSTEASRRIVIGVNEWLSAGSRYIFLPQSEHGVSYLLGYQDEAVDVMDFYHDQMSDDIGGTFVIRALAYTDRLGGDVDGDGSLTILDATHIQRYLASLRIFGEVDCIAADIDGDGDITILDATRVQRILAGYPH